VSTDDSTGTIALLFEGGKKQESFAGGFERPCSVPTKNGQPMRPSDIPVGTDLTVYYTEKKDKANGQKQNVIIGISVNSVKGKVVPEDSKRFFFCTEGGLKPFRAFH
jgi:hypothetical protein